MIAGVGGDFAQIALTGSLALAIPVAIIAGLVSFASPCVVPLVPGYLGYVSGMAGAQHGERGCVAAMDDSPGWDSVEMSHARLIKSAGVASVIYEFHGVRAGEDYRATLASSYRLPQRELFLHQQTPAV